MPLAYQLKRTILLSFICLAYFYSAAQPTQQFPAPDLHGYMGNAIAAYGDYAGFAALLGGERSSGNVNLYHLTNGKWKELQVLNSPRVDGPSRFGSSISMDKDQLAIGDTEFDGYNPYQGSVYIAKRNASGSYGIQQRLRHPGGKFGTNFGTAVSISGKWVAVGANYAIKMQNQGAVHLYHEQAGKWSHQQSIELDTAVGIAWFGANVQLEGDFLAVSAQYEAIHNKSKAGAVYVYRRNESGQYSLMKKLYVDIKISKTDQEFGQAISLRDGLLAVSAQAHRGFVYVYDLHQNAARIDLMQKPEYIPQDNPAHYHYGFGDMLSIDANYLVIGSSNAEERRYTAYIYKRSEDGGFRYNEYLRFPQKKSYDGYFTCQAAMTGPHIFISDPEDDLLHIDSTYADKPKGIVYSFKIRNYSKANGNYPKANIRSFKSLASADIQPVSAFSLSSNALLKQSDLFALDPFNGDNVFILRNKKTQKWGMYQALHTEWTELIPQRYDSVAFFGFNSPYTFVWNDGKYAMYPSRWNDDVERGYLPCLYTDHRIHKGNMAMKKDKVWVWIDGLGQEIPGIQAESFLDLPLPEDSMEK